MLFKKSNKREENCKCDSQKCCQLVKILGKSTKKNAFTTNGKILPQLFSNDFPYCLQCVLFGTFMIWFASITINLGPTFLSGALAANTESGHNAPSCPLVHGPFRHYILNVLWIVINIICVALTLFHLRKLHRDLTKANVEAVSKNIDHISNCIIINILLLI